MSRKAFLHRLLALVLIAAALELGLYALLGQRWFSFYGHATTALIIIVPVAWIITSRYRQFGLRLWPVWTFFALIGLAALAQIAYWTAFFYSRDLAITLAIGREMVLEPAGPYLVWIAIAAGIAGVWLTARVARGD